MDLTNIIRCPRCHSTQTYHRLKTNTRRCRACGNKWPGPARLQEPAMKAKSKQAA